LSDAFKNNVSISIRDIKEYARYLISKVSLSELESRISFDFVNNISKRLESKFSESERLIADSLHAMSKDLSINIEQKTSELISFENISAVVDKNYLSFYSKTEQMKMELESIGGPLKALAVGGALITKNGEIVSSIKQISSNDVIKINFVDGQVTSKVI